VKKRALVPRSAESTLRGDLAQMREQVTLKMFGLSERVYKHLLASAEAIKPCHACTVDKDGNHLPGKAKDEAGRCALCHGTYIVPDNNQRNWAVSEALPLITQAKPVEMKVDTASQLPELESEYKDLPDAVLSKLLSVITRPEVRDVKIVDAGPGAGEKAGTA
jgi:hypothetical protein